MIPGFGVLVYMSSWILDPIELKNLTPAEQLHYRKRMYIKRSSDKHICKECQATLEEHNGQWVKVTWKKPATKGSKGEWVPVVGGEACTENATKVHNSVSTPWMIDGKKVYLDDPEMKEYQEALVAYCHHLTGFPKYSMSLKEKRTELKKLLDFKHATILCDKEVKKVMTTCLTQTMHALGLAWTYFDHMWTVHCGQMKTPMEVFEDEKLFSKAIEKRLRWGTYISDTGLRKALRSFSGTQCVSNFRPTAAAAIYHKYLPESGGVTWDMSSGFGGRLLGAMACSRVTKYIGTDPSTDTDAGLRKMYDELLPLLKDLKPEHANFTAEFNKIGSEDFKPEPGGIDLCFTSPPYFDTERYSDEDTQSYIKYGRDPITKEALSKEASQDAWLNGFMRDTIHNCYVGLKSNGVLIINLAGVKSYPKLAEHFVNMVKNMEIDGTLCWEYKEEAKLILSLMMGTRKNSVDPFKTEPVFIFKKRT